jgi:hypothetical protein
MGLDYKNKTNLLKARLSIRSINNLEEFSQSFVFLLMMEFVWPDDGISNHSQMYSVMLTKLGVVPSHVGYIYGNLCPPHSASL